MKYIIILTLLICKIHVIGQSNEDLSPCSTDISITLYQFQEENTLLIETVDDGNTVILMNTDSSYTKITNDTLLSLSDVLDFNFKDILVEDAQLDTCRFDSVNTVAISEPTFKIILDTVVCESRLEAIGLVDGLNYAIFSNPEIEEASHTLNSQNNSIAFEESFNINFIKVTEAGFTIPINSEFQATINSLTIRDSINCNSSERIVFTGIPDNSFTIHYTNNNEEEFESILTSNETGQIDISAIPEDTLNNVFLTSDGFCNSNILEQIILQTSSNDLDNVEIIWWKDPINLIVANNVPSGYSLRWTIDGILDESLNNMTAFTLNSAANTINLLLQKTGSCPLVLLGFRLGEIRSNETLQFKLSLGPNPAQSNVFITQKGTAPLPFTWAIYGPDGKLNSMSNSQNIEDTIDISNLSPGLYFLKATAVNKSVQTIKFIKQ